MTLAQPTVAPCPAAAPAIGGGYDTDVSAQDVFGNINAVVSGLRDSGTLIGFDCGSDRDDPIMAFLVPMADPVDSLHPAEVFVRTLQGAVISAKALFSARNDDAGAVIAAGTGLLERTAKGWQAQCPALRSEAGSGLTAGMSARPRPSRRGRTAAASAWSTPCPGRWHRGVTDWGRSDVVARTSRHDARAASESILDIRPVAALFGQGHRRSG